MAQVGFENYLYVDTGSGSNTWTEVDLARDVTINKEKDEIDATARVTARKGWKATEEGLKNLSVEFESLKPAVGETANAAFTKLEQAYLNNATITVLLADAAISSTEAAPAIKVDCGVYGGTEGQPLNDMATIKYTLKNKSVPIYGTVSGGTFTANA